MASLIVNGEEKEVAELSSLIEVAEDMDVPFGCQSGMCRTCEVEVLEGEKNLTEKTDAETILPEKHRLLCQCQIKEGTVKTRKLN